jgi:hypothetical protein
VAAKRGAMEERKRRRRQWYHAAQVPDVLVGKFTAGELAAVGAAIDTIKRAGGRPCALRRTQIANQAGVSTTTYDKAMRKARDLGLLKRTRQGPAPCPSLYEMGKTQAGPRIGTH